MINRRLFTTAAAVAVLFSCFISTAISACGKGSVFGDMTQAESYHLPDNFRDGEESNGGAELPTDDPTTDGVSEGNKEQDTETHRSDTTPEESRNTTTDSESGGESSSATPTTPIAPTTGENGSTADNGTTGSTAPSVTETESGTDKREPQSSEAVQVENPVQPVEHSVEFFFKVPGYTGKSYYDLYLHDGFVPIESVSQLSEYCTEELLTLRGGKKSISYIITPQGIFDDMTAGLTHMDERASSDGSITDIYARDAYLYEQLGLDYQTFYSRGLSIFKIKKMGDVGNGAHSIYAIYYYSYEDAGQTDMTKAAVKKAVEGFLGSDYDRILAAYDYLCANTVYSDDADSYEAHSAYGALISGKAVCEGYAKAYKLMLDEMGIDNYIVINSTHAWNIVLYNGEWYFVDVTNGDFNSCYAYFMLGDDVLGSGVDLLIDSYVFSAEAIAYYGYTDGENTDENTLAHSSVSERIIEKR